MKKVLFLAAYLVVCVLVYYGSYRLGACHMMPKTGYAAEMMGCGPNPAREPDPFPSRVISLPAVTGMSGRTITIAATTMGTTSYSHMSSGGVVRMISTGNGWVVQK